YPVTEAGYAFDVFQILNQAIILSLHKNKPVTTQAIAQQIHSISIDKGVMGPLKLDSTGVLFSKSVVKVIKNDQVLTA
ncbi:MAG: amino acid-binding protein, partial [bacterium]|nr:amino acid-binding protein [bacterium]